VAPGSGAGNRRRCEGSVYATAMADITVASEVDGDGEEEEPLVEDELLVEEISIDGMCGVY
jgi:mycofactocin precursor